MGECGKSGAGQGHDNECEWSTPEWLAPSAAAAAFCIESHRYARAEMANKLKNSLIRDNKFKWWSRRSAERARCTANTKRLQTRRKKRWIGLRISFVSPFRLHFVSICVWNLRKWFLTPVARLPIRADNSRLENIWRGNLVMSIASEVRRKKIDWFVRRRDAVRRVPVIQSAEVRSGFLAFGHASRFSWSRPPAHARRREPAGPPSPRIRTEPIDLQKDKVKENWTGAAAAEGAP